MDFDEDDEDQNKAKGPKFPLCMYITEGVKYLKLRMFDKAINCFNSALEREPANEKSLLGRAKCFMSKGMYNDAKQDAEAALKVNPKSPQAKVLKAESEYFVGDFERSFLTYARAHNSRPNFGAFKLGFQSCRKAIDNALRPDDLIYFDDMDVKDIEGLLSGETPEEEDAKLAHYKDDIKFLRDLLTDEDIESIHPHCEYLMEFLKGRQLFWRYQNPKTS